MLKILRKGGKIAPEEQFLPLSTIFYYLMLDFYVKTGIRFSLRDKRLFEITEVEIMRVDCIYILGVFTEKLYSKPLERNVVNIPITTSSQATLVSQNKAWFLQSEWMLALFRSYMKTA